MLMELELLWLLAPDVPASSWFGGLTLPAWAEILTATTLIYANGAGIIMAADTRHTHFLLAGGTNTSCLD